MKANALSEDHVRKHTDSEVNRKIDDEFECSVRRFSSADHDSIVRRLNELDCEWDVERVLETNASSLALGGTLLGITVNKKWFILPLVVTGFLLNHAVFGWCPPLPLLRRLGVRTSKEIERERYALLALMGRFDEAQRNPDGLTNSLA